VRLVKNTNPGVKITISTTPLLQMHISNSCPVGEKHQPWHKNIMIIVLPAMK